MKRVVIVHGGAWKIPKNQEKLCLEGVEKAAQLAMNCLLNHNSALDAVEVAVRCIGKQSSLRRIYAWKNLHKYSKNWIHAHTHEKLKF